MTKWAAVLGESLRGSAIALDNAVLRFASASQGAGGVGISAIDVLPQNRSAIIDAAKRRGLPHDDRSVELGGLRINLV